MQQITSSISGMDPDSDPHWEQCGPETLVTVNAKENKKI